MSTKQDNSTSPLKAGLIVLAISLLSPVLIDLSFNPENYPIPDVHIFGVLWQLESTISSGVSISPSIFVMMLSALGELSNPEYWTDISHMGGVLWILLASMMPVFILSTRLIFVNHIINRYRGKSTRRRTWILGLLSESFFIFSAIMICITIILDSRLWFSIAIPLPLTLLTGLMLLKYRPTPEKAIPWKGLDEQKEW
jgi:hypothetical protein